MAHTPPPRHAVIVDTDAAFDDLFALTLLAANPDGAFDLALVTTVRGFLGPSEGAGVVWELLARLGHPTAVPIVAGADRPGAGGHALEDVGWGPEVAAGIPDKLATLGLGLLPVTAEATHSPAAAAESLLRTAQEHCGHCSLVCLGPLTNVADALTHGPGILQRCVTSVIVMGGAVRAPGNCGPDDKAEFNFFCDPQAACVVLNAGLPITLVDLGLCASPALADLPAKVLALPPSTSAAELLQRLAACDPLSVSFDAIAMAALLRPALFQHQRVGIRLDDDGVTHECLGEAAGATVTLLTAVDVPGFEQLIRAAADPSTAKPGGQT